MNCIVVGSYFEIWVWNASILVRVLVSSSNTFSCWRKATYPFQLAKKRQDKHKANALQGTV